jgi:hypothetical protein
MSNKDLTFLLKVIVILAMAFHGMYHDAFGHESNKYHHQTERITRYGGGYIWGGIYRTFVNAEHTQCRDLIFNHDMMHVTEPFECKETDGGIKDMSQED